MSYTVRDTPEVRRRIGAELQQAVHTVRDGDPRLRALVLTGGFARGEGAVRDGAPQNDYDLVAVRGLGPPRVPYDKMRRRLEQRLGLHIDLAAVWERRLRFTAPSIFWYETALRGQVLWGDRSVLRRIPTRQSQDIRRDEAMRLLVNRSAGLLLATRQGDDDKRIQASKALLGALDAELLVRGQFPPTHRERWTAFEELLSAGVCPPSLEGRIKDLQWALVFKTDPEAAEPVPGQQAWLLAADAVLDAIPAALEHAGLRDLDHYARRERWVERAHYWNRAGSVGARRWARHPTARVRAATVRMLQSARQGQLRDGEVARLLPGADAPLDALDSLRQVTLQ